MSDTHRDIGTSVHRGIGAAIVAVVLAAGVALGAQQAPPSSKGVVIKGRAPVSTDVLKVKLPRPVEADLPNGAHLMVLEDHRVPQVVFQILVSGAGGYFDPAVVPGLGLITATMMREGTTTRTTAQISEQLERMAAAVNVGTSMSSLDATITGSSLTDNFDDTFKLAADILLNPTFPDEELARYKQRTRTTLIQQRTSASFLSVEMFSRVMYGTHPAARSSVTAPVLDTLTRAQLVDFYRAHYVPDHAVIAMSGDITMAAARKAVDATLATWKRANGPAPAAQDPPPTGATKIYFVARPNSVQTNIVVGTQGIDRLAPDYDRMTVMNSVIGGGPTGRLFVILREEKGYTYGAYSGFNAVRFRGNWSANTEVRTEVTDDALRDLLAEIKRLRDEPVADKELQDKKRGIVASFALSLESPQSVLNNHITRWIYKLPADYWDRFPERIDAVTQAQVQETAKKYLDSGRLQIVIVGDPKIGDLLKKYGTVETYDVDGKRTGG